MAHKNRGLAERFPLVDGLDQVIDLVGRQDAAGGPLQLVAAIDEDTGEASLGVDGGKQGLVAPGGQIQYARDAVGEHHEQAPSPQIFHIDKDRHPFGSD